MKSSNTKHERLKLAFSIIEVCVVLAICVLLGALIWGGWQNHLSSSVESGVIVRKVYEAASVSTDLVDAGGTLVPVSKSSPERWKIVIRGVNKDGEMRERIVPVDRETYHHAKTGTEISVSDL